MKASQRTIAASPATHVEHKGDPKNVLERPRPPEPTRAEPHAREGDPEHGRQQRGGADGAELGHPDQPPAEGGPGAGDAQLKHRRGALGRGDGEQNAHDRDDPAMASQGRGGEGEALRQGQ